LRDDKRCRLTVHSFQLYAVSFFLVQLL
jgi:hypothetical protein